MSEHWKPIFGYEGIYRISDCGRVHSLARTVIAKNGRVIKVTSKILRAGIGSHGYYAVMLCRGGGQDLRNVHVLVAEAFIPNHDPEHLTDAEHINRIPTDNLATNLRWATRRLNNLNRPQLFIPKKINASRGVYRFCGKHGKIKYRAYLSNEYLGSFLRLSTAIERRRAAYAQAVLEETARSNPKTNEIQ